MTGANAVWITAGRHPLIPGRFQVPAVTQGRELLRAGQALPAGAALRLVIDLPADLGQLSEAEREPVARFLRWAASAGAADGYVARHRTPWWRVRLGPPAPILASYMARRPPAFVRNLAAARHLNIAHGLYPRDPLAAPLLDALAAALAGSVTTGQGRVYAGGLVKFEPREMERLPVPGPAAAGRGGLADRAAAQIQPWYHMCDSQDEYGMICPADDRVQVREVQQHAEHVGADHRRRRPCGGWRTPAPGR